MIATQADIERQLAALLALDPRLEPIARAAGPVPLRRGEPGLAGLCATILAQQVSVASAAAIHSRLRAALDLSDPRAVAEADDDVFRLAGLSRPKQRTLRAIGAAIVEGRLDLARVASLPADAAIAEMVAVHGIGPWTAECHLLFAIGHEDVFPAGDLALQIAVERAFSLGARPGERALRQMALAFAPHRSIAARLFWAYYHSITRRDGAPTLVAGTEGFTKPTR